MKTIRKDDRDIRNDVVLGFSAPDDPWFGDYQSSECSDCRAKELPNSHDNNSMP